MNIFKAVKVHKNNQPSQLQMSKPMHGNNTRPQRGTNPNPLPNQSKPNPIFDLRTRIHQYPQYADRGIWA